MLQQNFAISYPKPSTLNPKPPTLVENQVLYPLPEASKLALNLLAAEVLKLSYHNHNMGIWLKMLFPYYSILIQVPYHSLGIW